MDRLNSNNFNVGGNKHLTPHQPSTKKDAPGPSLHSEDAVTIGRSPATGRSPEDTKGGSVAPSTLNETNIPTSFSAPGISSPTTISSIGADGSKMDLSGLTGLNSLSSVVSTGRFEGFKGSYGQTNPFSDRGSATINREGEWTTPSHISRDGEWVSDTKINRDGEWT